MPNTSPVLLLPGPELDDPNNVPDWFDQLRDRLDSLAGIGGRYTTGNRDLIAGAELYNGRFLYNLSTHKFDGYMNGVWKAQATEAYVDAAITALIGTAGTSLDTLGELSDALNDDANLAATLTALINAKLALAGGTMSGSLQMADNSILRAFLSDTAEAYYDAGNSGASITLDYTNGPMQKVTLNAATPAIAFSNWPASGRSGSMMVKFFQDGTGSRIPSWAAAVKWPAATAPTLTTTAGARDRCLFTTEDAGTTIDAMVAGLAFG